MSSWARLWTWYSGERCRVGLDIGPGTAESAVELDSTLKLVQRKALSSWIRYWNWYSGKRCQLNSILDLIQQKSLSSWTRNGTRYSGKCCWVGLDTWPGTAESDVELKSILELVQQKTLSDLARHWTWYNGKWYPVESDSTLDRWHINTTGKTPSAVGFNLLSNPARSVLYLQLY